MLKIAADFDFELAFSKLSKQLDEQQKALERYLTKPHGDLRNLFVNIPTPAAATPPAILDLGAPGGGLLWSVQQVSLITGTTLTNSAASNVAAGIFVGTLPTGQGIQFQVDVSSCVAAGLSVPANYQAGGKSIIVRAHQHLYVILQGTGINANAWTATATVLQIPDTSEALLWL